MKTFWRQTAVFAAIVIAAAAVVIATFYLRGIKSDWVVYSVNSETSAGVGILDVKKLEKILNEVENTPASQEEIEAYKKSTEWTGFVFSNSKTQKIYSFSSNHEILTIYAIDTSSQSESMATSTNNSETTFTSSELDDANFSFYYCDANHIEQIKTIYNNYFE